MAFRSPCPDCEDTMGELNSTTVVDTTVHAEFNCPDCERRWTTAL